MNIHHPSSNLWAKLTPLTPGKASILLYQRSNEQNQYEVPEKWIIHQISNGSIWIRNLAASEIQVDDICLKKDEIIELHGGETISFGGSDRNYVFSLHNSQLKNELKRSRDKAASVSSTSEAKNRLENIEEKSKEELKC